MLGSQIDQNIDPLLPQRLKARKCSNEELELVHSHAHVCKYAAGLPRNKGDKPECKLIWKITGNM